MAGSLDSACVLDGCPIRRASTLNCVCLIRKDRTSEMQLRASWTQRTGWFWPTRADGLRASPAPPPAVRQVFGLSATGSLERESPLFSCKRMKSMLAEPIFVAPPLRLSYFIQVSNTLLSKLQHWLLKRGGLGLEWYKNMNFNQGWISQVPRAAIGVVHKNGRRLQRRAVRDCAFHSRLSSCALLVHDEQCLSSCLCLFIYMHLQEGFSPRCYIFTCFPAFCSNLTVCLGHIKQSDTFIYAERIGLSVHEILPLAALLPRY